MVIGLLTALISTALGQREITVPPPSRLHYKPSAGWFGDAHPVFFKGEWLVYYIEVPDEPFRRGLDGMESALVVSRDLIHWEKRNIIASRPLRPLEITTDQEHRGKLFSLYGGSPLGIDLAISEDGILWNPVPANPVMPFPPERGKLIQRFTDPHTFYNPAEGLYYATLTVNMIGRPEEVAGLLYGATSEDMFTWSKPKPIYDPGNLPDPECPDLFNLGGYFYLLAGWSPGGRVGQAFYRIADHPGGPWRIPPIDSLDSTEFKVPNSATDGNRRLLFGWVPTYVQRRDYERGEWAGHMAFPREFAVGEKGILYLKAPEELKELRNESIPVEPLQLIHGKAVVSKEGIQNQPGEDYVEILLPGESTYYELEATFTLGADCPAAGMIIHAGEGVFAGYEVVIDVARQVLLLRTRHELHRHLAFTEISLSSGETAHLRMIVDGDIVEAFLNDRYSLVGRIHRMPAHPRTGFFVHRGEATIRKIARYELKMLFPPQSPKSNRITPDAATLNDSAGSALFPVMSAHVYTRFQPELNFQESFTLECRVLVTPGAENRKANLIVKGDAQWGYHYGFNLMPGNAVEIYFKSSTDFVALTSEPDCLPAPGNWVHLVGVVDREARMLRLYADGREVGSRSFDNEPLDMSNQGALRLGYPITIRRGDQFFGLMDDVRLWSRALTASEVKNLSQSQKVKPDAPGLVLWWNFDQPFVRTDGDANRIFVENLAVSNAELRAGFYAGAQVVTD